MTPHIFVADRTSYAEAAEITQRSPAHLLHLATAGRLTRVAPGHTDRASRIGGAAYRGFFSRTEVEALAVQEYRKGRTGSYWMTMTQVAELAGVHRSAVHLARDSGRLPAVQTPCGDWLVRRTDAYRFHLDRQLTAQSTGWRKQQATKRRNRSTVGE